MVGGDWDYTKCGCEFNVKKNHSKNMVLVMNFRVWDGLDALSTTRRYADGYYVYDKKVLSIYLQDSRNGASFLVKKPAAVFNQLLEQGPIFKIGFPFQGCGCITQTT